MTGQDIISAYELYVDDANTLSSTEELALLNRVYHKVLNARVWSFLVTSASGVVSSSVPYIALPSDFKYMSPNQLDQDTQAWYTVVFIGSTYEPYKLISIGERNNYRQTKGIFYLDNKNRRIVFTKQPTSADAYDYDYVYQPVDLTTATSPVFPSYFHDIIFYGMAAEFDLIQQTEKQLSYNRENSDKYSAMLTLMALEDERIKAGI